MRKFFITDIHGDDVALEKVLEHVRFDPRYDQLIVGGDMIDRGKGSGKVVKKIKFLCDNYPEHVKAIIGNHEEMMGWYLNGRSGMWLIHGGLEAIQSFNSTFPNESELKEHLEWACSLPLYVEDDAFFYCHAGVDPHELLDNQSREILWMTEHEFYHFYPMDLLALTNGKPIVHGHTPVERIVHDGSRINCDMGSQSYSIVEERGLGLVNLTDMEYYLYKPFKRVVEKKTVFQY